MKKNLSVLIQEARNGRNVALDVAKASAEFLEAYSKLAAQTTNVVALASAAFKGASVIPSVQEAATRIAVAASALQGDLTEKTYRLIDKTPSVTRQAARHLMVGASRVLFEKLHAAFVKDNPQATFDDFKMALLVLADSFAEARGISEATPSSSPGPLDERYVGMPTAGSPIQKAAAVMFDNRDGAYRTFRQLTTEHLKRLNDGIKVDILLGKDRVNLLLAFEISGPNMDSRPAARAAIAKFLGLEPGDIPGEVNSRTRMTMFSISFRDPHSYMDFSE